ncbi:MAG: serine hydrolase [Alphaproteobacteria bacterium]|nr:serine hydrolase [Alphaproteobacteria bacterium]
MHSPLLLPRIGAAFKAKQLASGVFVSGRDAASVRAADVHADNLWYLASVSARVDPAARRVEAAWFGLSRETAVWRPGLGCTVAIGTDPDGLAARLPALPPVPAPDPGRPWPEGDAPSAEPPPGVDARALAAALDAAFAEPDPARLRRTRAALVVQKGRIVAERYAPGIAATTPLLGWSMTKAVLNALLGIQIGQGALALDADDLMPEWRERPDDPRRRITLDHMLRMSSGLAFDETYANPLSDVTVMLFGTGDAAALAIDRPLAHPPGAHFAYASGTSNILGRLLRDRLGDDAALAQPRAALFAPLGMASAVLEPDAAGTPLFSSYMYATARDWARLGLLYLQDGIWQGRRLLPEGWARYTATPAPAAPAGEYGAHVWTQVPGVFRQGRTGPDALPKGTWHLAGFEGQFVTIVPARETVIVRLGLARRSQSWDQERFVLDVLAALG